MQLPQLPQPRSDTARGQGQGHTPHTPCPGQEPPSPSPHPTLRCRGHGGAAAAGSAGIATRHDSNRRALAGIEGEHEAGVKPGKFHSLYYAGNQIRLSLGMLQGLKL